VEWRRIGREDRIGACDRAALLIDCAVLLSSCSWWYQQWISGCCSPDFFTQRVVGCSCVTIPPEACFGFIFVASTHTISNNGERSIPCPRKFGGANLSVDSRGGWICTNCRWILPHTFKQRRCHANEDISTITSVYYTQCHCVWHMTIIDRPLHRSTTSYGI